MKHYKALSVVPTMYFYAGSGRRPMIILLDNLWRSGSDTPLPIRPSQMAAFEHEKTGCHRHPVWRDKL
jgi:hypothetical protein